MQPGDSRALSRGSSSVGEVIGAFESETAAVFLRTAPVREHIITYVLAAMLLTGLLLAAVVKLDRVVTGMGRIVPLGGSLYVSPFDTGIVRQVYVRAGDIVKKGQALASLDPTFTRADVRQLEQKLAGDEAAVQRLGAELANASFKPASNDPPQQLQFAIWEKRRAEYRYNLADFDARIHAAESQVAQFRSSADDYSKRLKLADEVEKLYTPLLERGYVSKLQLMQATDERVEVERLLADAQNQTRGLSETLASLKAQRDAFIQKWHSDAGTELATVRDDLNLTRQSLEKARKLDELVSLVAPASSVVLKVGKVSPGSVTGSGAASVGQEPLFTLVPLDAPLGAEIHVNSADIGFVRVGDPVQIKLDAYNFIRHGTAKGVIRSISEGSFSTDENNVPVSPYFQVNVTIDQVHLRNVPGNFRLIPGMTVGGDVLVGRRTLLSYVLEGALRTGTEAMREPQ